MSKASSPCLTKEAMCATLHRALEDSSPMAIDELSRAGFVAVAAKEIAGTGSGARQCLMLEKLQWACFGGSSTVDMQVLRKVNPQVISAVWKSLFIPLLQLAADLGDSATASFLLSAVAFHACETVTASHGWLEERDIVLTKFFASYLSAAVKAQPALALRSIGSSLLAFFVEWLARSASLSPLVRTALYTTVLARIEQMFSFMGRTPGTVDECRSLWCQLGDLLTARCELRHCCGLVLAQFGLSLWGGGATATQEELSIAVDEFHSWLDVCSSMMWLACARRQPPSSPLSSSSPPASKRERASAASVVLEAAATYASQSCSSSCLNMCRSTVTLTAEVTLQQWDDLIPSSAAGPRASLQGRWVELVSGLIHGLSAAALRSQDHKKCSSLLSCVAAATLLHEDASTIDWAVALWVATLSRCADPESGTDASAVPLVGLLVSATFGAVDALSRTPLAESATDALRRVAFTASLVAHEVHPRLPWVATIATRLLLLLPTVEGGGSTAGSSRSRESSQLSHLILAPLVAAQQTPLWLPWSPYLVRSLDLYAAAGFPHDSPLREDLVVAKLGSGNHPIDPHVIAKLADLALAGQFHPSSWACQQIKARCKTNSHETACALFRLLASLPGGVVAADATQQFAAAARTLARFMFREEVLDCGTVTLGKQLVASLEAMEYFASQSQTVRIAELGLDPDTTQFLMPFIRASFGRQEQLPFGGRADLDSLSGGAGSSVPAAVAEAAAHAVSCFSGCWVAMSLLQSAPNWTHATPAGLAAPERAPHPPSKRVREDDHHGGGNDVREMLDACRRKMSCIVDMLVETHSDAETVRNAQLGLDHIGAAMRQLAASRGVASSSSGS